MLPSLVLWIATRVFAIALALVVAWSVTTAAVDAIADATRQAQAEIDAGSSIEDAAAYNAKELSVDRSGPWS